MKKVFMSLICLLLMMTASLSAKAQEITVTLLPGCTWISYTRAEAMSITAALGDFVPMQGDVIKSQYGSATYNHGRWMGRLQQFSPGLGYMYISMRSEPVSLVFATPSTLEGALTVSTSEPMDITATTAICGGSAISIDGTSILMKGVCWATHPYPTTDDEYTENGSGSGSFSAELTELVLNTVYYVRAYAVTVKGINYGNELSFIANHDYVDLGLPSGTLWATCNVGAYVPEAYGDYFAWGETEPKSNYNWSTYQYCNGSSSKLTKYCTNSSYGYNGFTDDLTTLLPEDDAATANWGDDWRMPTKEEWQELYNNTTCTWTTLNGVDGRLFTAANGNSIFLPAAGYRNGTSFSGSTGDYLSSTLYSNIPSRAWELNFGSDNCSMSSYGHRKLGLSVRAVRVLRNHDYVDLGLPSGTMWATCNVGANTPGEYGGYFAWGETTPKSSNSWWDTYQYCNGTFWYEWYDEGYEEWDGYEIPLLTKYCTDSYYGYNGFTDNLTTLLPEDDAATANWGAGWRMPTSEEWIELRNNTTSTRMTQNGVQGHLLTASNGNSLFLPDAFYSSFSSWGHYWSCSLNAGNPSGAWSFYIDYYYSTDMRAEDRCNGLFVRAVHCKNSVINVTANPEEGGSVSGGGTYMDHTNCTLTAMAKEGYTFVCWTDHGEVVSTNASYTFVVTGNRELVANFSLPLTITASVNLEEGGTVTGAGAYDYGTECMLMAVPNEGYTFINWTDHGEVVSTNASYSFVVTGDRELVANFSLPFTIMASINPEEGGTIAGAGEYDYGTECMLMAVPNEGYTFINWTDHGEVVSTNASYSFVVTGDRELVANFSLPFTIMVSINPEEGGTIAGAGEYDYGTECMLMAVPNEGYTFINWTDHGEVVSTNASYSFIVTGDRELVANFSLPFTIMVSINPEEGGTIAGAGEYDYGTECMLMAVPNEGYTFINWTENGIEVSSEASYSFTVTGDRNLEANFANFVDPNTHYYVDLGLPSGLLWATCNVGACVPEAYGDHFAWGETTPKNTYNWYTYQYCNIEDIWELGGETVFLSKYCTLSDFGGEDDLTILLPEDDAATANWGAGWRMPTSEEWSELLNNTTSTWTTQNGVNGRLFTASNGNSLFLPATGNRWDDELYGAGYYGNYWSSSLGITYWDPDEPYDPYLAGDFSFGSGNYGMGNSERSNGLSVRPVREN